MEINENLDAAREEFERVRDWAKASPEHREIVHQPEVENLLAVIIIAFVSPPGSTAMVNQTGLEATMHISQASFMAGYKRRLDTEQMEKMTESADK